VTTGDAFHRAEIGSVRALQRPTRATTFRRIDGAAAVPWSITTVGVEGDRVLLVSTNEIRQ